MSKALFPACAYFGPFITVNGFLLPAPYGYFVALPGALMTSVALHIIYRAMTTVDRRSPFDAGTTSNNTMPSDRCPAN